MKTYTEKIEFNTKNRIEIVNITEKINEIISRSGVSDGLVLINPMHITSAIIVNDEEEGLKQDFITVLERLVPYKDTYKHNIGEDNAAAHIWRQFIGHQVVMPITNGKLDLGPWEQIFYCEFDGMRRKKIIVKIVGE